MEKLMDILSTSGLRLLGGIAVLVIGFVAVHYIMKMIDKSKGFAKLEQTLKSFVHNVIRMLLTCIIILTAVGIMGVPMTSVVTLLASAGVAISLAVQGALSNLVGGLMLLFLKPIKAGEYVKVGDIEGTIRSIGTFYTEMVMPDNRFISVPNSNLTNTAIINYSRQGTRRLDVTFAVSYKADMQQVFDILLGLIKGREEVLPDPAPVVHITAMNDSGVNYTVRLWCKNAEYWNLFFYLTEQGKRALEENGIEIPYPQLDVHIK